MPRSSSPLRIVRDDLKKKPYKTVRSQELNGKKAEERVTICADFLGRIRDGRFDPKKIVFTPEKLSRREKGAGTAGKNSRACVDAAVGKKAGVGAKDLVQESETWRQSVMCAAGLSYGGFVGPYIVEKGV